MLHAFTVDPKRIRLVIGSERDTSVPLRFSANPYTRTGLPVGMLAVEGLVHSSLPEGLPALIFYKDGGVEIRRSYELSHVISSRYLISASCVLVEKGDVVPAESPLNIRPDSKLPRLAAGLRLDGTLLVVEQTCTVRQLAYCMKALDAYDAVMLSFDDVHIEYTPTGLRVGEPPVVTLEALKAQEIPRPIIVLDAAHGGEDEGTAGFGLREKDLTLKGTLVAYEYLREHYEGTYILTRSRDVTMSLEDRADLVSGVKADYAFSLHHRAGRGGFETYVSPHASDVTKDVHHRLHRYVADYVIPFGLTDRGPKYADSAFMFPESPTILLESLSLNAVDDVYFLNNASFLKGLYKRIAEGIARSCGIPKKLAYEPADIEATLYKVQIGAFRFRKSAEELLETLRNAGFHEARIVAETKKAP